MKVTFVGAMLGLISIGCAASSGEGQQSPPEESGASSSETTSGASSSGTTSGPTTTTTVIDECDLTVSAPASIQSAVDSQPNGATICLSGTFTTQRVVPKDRQTFIGPAVLDGRGSTHAAFDNGGSDVTIRNLEVRNYASPVQNGAIQSGRGWNLFNSEIHNNAGGGVSFGGSGTIIDGNHIHNNGQIAIILQDADNSRVEDNELNDNNFRDAVDYGFESGGIKLLRSDNVVMRGNYVHDNHGPGMWSDDDNYNILYEDNIVSDNYGPGILHEISYDAVIRNNTVTGNALQFYVGGILVASSSNVEVYGNNLSGNHGGIIGLQDSRGSGNRGTFQTTGLNVHDNNVSWTNGYHGIQVNSGPDITNSNTITFSGNDYTANGTRPFKWGSSNSNLTWQQWQSLGHDTVGTFGTSG